MRETSALYKSLRTATGSYYEVEVVRGNTTYTMADLKSIEITPALYEDAGPQIGHTHSTQCKLKLIERSANWPRMASFTVRVRLSSADGLQKSEWLSMGTYYTDERSEEKYGDLSIIAFDGMLLLEQSWTDKIPAEQVPESWPITGRAACTLLTAAVGCVFDNITDIDDEVAFVGLDTTKTARDVLNDIAAGNGGNWQMTAEGHLRFVGMASSTEGVPAIAGVAVAGISIVGTDSDDGEEMGDAGKTYVGMNLKSLEYSPKLSGITGVELSTEDGTIATAGNDTGYVVKADCGFSDSEIAAVCLSRVSGMEYSPFEATGAELDPAAEVGDLVMIAGEYYQMVQITWKIATSITADMSAPFEEEVDHEYTMQSEIGLLYKKTVSNLSKLEERVYSSIEQSAGQIMTQVGETYETIQDSEAKYVDVNTTITQTKEALDIDIQTVSDDLSELAMHYRFDENGETIGRAGSEKSIRLAHDGIDLNVNSEAVVRITQEELLAPKRVNVPISGTLQLGNFIFQPRSSGNTSLLWIGS